MTDLSALRVLAELATPGPWRTGRFMPTETIMRHQVVAPDVEGIPYVILEGNSNFPSDAERNAAFVAAANPQAILALLDLVVEAAETLDTLTSKLPPESEIRQKAETRAKSLVAELYRAAGESA